MAEIIYPVGDTCQINEPHCISTDEDVGLTFEVAKPDPTGLRQRECMVIIAEMHNLDCAYPYRHKLEITREQAQEVGKWLTRRAKEMDKRSPIQRLRSIFRPRVA